MTQAPTDAGTPAPAALEPSAPAPAAPEAPSPSPEPEMFSIPMDQVPEQFRTGDFHNLISAAKSYGQVTDSGILDVEKAIRQSGMDPREFLNFISEAEGGEPLPVPPIPAPAGEPPAPAPTEDPNQPMTRADFERYRAEDESKHQAARDADSEKNVRLAEDNAARSVLHEVGVELSVDGKLNTPQEKVAFGHWLQTLQQVRRETANPGLPADHVEKMIRMNPPTAAEVTAARDRFRNDWADITNTVISKFASGQDDVPSATLGSGPGGAGGDAPMSQADWDSMTPAAQRQMLEARMAAKRPGGA